MQTTTKTATKTATTTLVAAEGWTAKEAKQVARIEELTTEWTKLQAAGEFAAAATVMTSLRIAENALAGMCRA